MKRETIEKLIKRIDQLNAGEVQRLLLRLAEEKGFFQEVFEALRDGVIVFNSMGMAAYVNVAAEKIFELDKRSLLKLHFDQLVGRTSNWQQMQESKAAISHDVEVDYPTHRHLNFYMLPLGEEGAAYLLIIRDDTAQHKHAEDMLESEKLSALTLLAAGVAHEIGNPLNSLGLNLQLVKRKLVNCPAEVQEMLSPLVDTAYMETTRLDGILKQFLQAIRPSKLQRSQCNLNDLWQQVLTVLQPELEAHDIHISEDFAKDLPEIAVDSLQIQQVFFNVLKNAYQSIPNGRGSIFISTNFNEQEIRCLISDTGSGISHEVMGSIYEPYLTTKPKGSGLGLLIVRRIIKDHGGSLTIASKEGIGTSLSIVLPRHPRSQRLIASS